MWKVLIAGLVIFGVYRLADAETVPTGPQNIQAVPGTSAGLAPFMRSGDPFIFPAGTTAAQYTISQPSGTTSYRIVDPCNVDIRIKSVPDTNTSVTLTTGTRFLSRTAEAVASVANPLGPSAIDRIISIMTTSDPGSAGCSVELSYGNGG